MRKKIALLLTFALCFGATLGAMAQTGRIAILLEGSRGDLSFNDMGTKGAEAAVTDLNLELDIVQNAAASDYLPNLRNLSRSEQYDLIISFGFLQADAVRQAASEFPDQKYLTVGGVITDRSNVMAILFHENEVSALIGALAALTAAHHGYPRAGIVLGVEIPVLYHFEAGYRFGMQWGLDRYAAETGLTPEVGMLYTYTGTFQDIAVGRIASEAMLAQGAASIYNVAGALGIGDLQAITAFHTQEGTRSGPPYFFGVDANQDYLGEGFHGLASAMKRIDNATYQAIETVANGTFAGGLRVLGLADSGVGISKLQDLEEFLQFGIEAGAISSDAYYSTIANWAANRATVPQWIWDAIGELEVLILSEALLIPTANTPDEMGAIRMQYPLGAP